MSKRMTKSERQAGGVVLLVILGVIIAVFGAVSRFLTEYRVLTLLILAVAAIVGGLLYMNDQRQKQRAREELEALAEETRLSFKEHPTLFTLLEPSFRVANSDSTWAIQKKMIEGRTYAKRVQDLVDKYQDDQIVERIYRKEVWQGETAEMVRDSLGAPIEIDQEVLKTKTKEIWKYRLLGRGQYGLRVILEGGKVVGWKDNRK